MSHMIYFKLKMAWRYRRSDRSNSEWAILTDQLSSRAACSCMSRVSLGDGASEWAIPIIE